MPTARTRAVVLALAVTVALLLGAGPSAEAEPSGGADRLPKPSAVTSFWSGTIQPGATKTWHWNNAPAQRIYQVGLSPAGATTTKTCQFEVVKNWYETTYPGEREFYWRIQNVGGLACGTTVLLTAVVADATTALGTIAPGSSVTIDRPFQHLGDRLDLFGLTASGATASTDCRVRVESALESFEPEPEWAITVRNDGSAACAATLLSGTTVQPAFASLKLGQLDPGSAVNVVWNNANPLSAAHVVNPAVGEYNQCAVQVTRLYYRQRLNRGGATERELVFRIERTDGGPTCSVFADLAMTT